MAVRSNPLCRWYDFHIKMKGDVKMVTTIRIPDDLHKRLKEEAEKRGMTFNGYLLVVLWDSFKKDRQGSR